MEVHHVLRLALLQVQEEAELAVLEGRAEALRQCRREVKGEIEKKEVQQPLNHSPNAQPSTEP